MAMIEDAIVNLKVDDSDASSKWLENKEAIKDLNAELRRMKEAGEVGSDGYKEIQRELKDLKAEQKEMLHNVDLTTASINQMQDAVNFWTREAKKAEQGSEEWVNATKKLDEIKPILNEAQSELRSFGTEVEKQPSLWDTMKLSILSVFTGMGLLELVKAVGQAMFDFGKEIFETTAKFQTYEAILTNAIGSHEEAVKAMKEVKDMAATTPFTVDELTEAYVKMTNRGLQPSTEQMKAMADMAATTGKDFSQLTEALLDGAEGQIKRFADIGISAEKNGEKIDFTFKGVKTSVDSSMEGMLEAMVFFQENAEGVAGMTDIISGTLEGRASNLGDAYDSLKVAIGERLMPAFNFLLDTMREGITFVTDLISGNSELSDSTSWLGNVFESLGEILGTIWDVVVEVVDIGAQLFTQLAKITDGIIETSGAGTWLENVLSLISAAFRIVGSMLIATVTGLTVLAEGFNVLINKGKEVANFFGSDFKIDTSATWANMNKHAEENISGINKLWADSGKETEKVHESVADTHKKSIDKQAANSKAATDKAQREAEKLAKDKEKAEADLIKKVADMEIKAIADDTQRKTAKANLDYKRETDAINKSKANEATKNKALQALEKSHEAEIAKINADARKKEEAEALKAQKEAEKNKKVWLAFVKAIKDQELKDTKALLDAEFIAKIDNAKVSLALAKDGSQAEFEAKKAVLDAELAYKRAKLNAEADAERARIADSISSNETKAQRLKAVEDKLSADLILTEAQTADAKNKIDQAATDEKNRRKEEFYKGLNLAMQGDLNGFIKYLQEKSQKDTKYLDERKAAQLKQANEIGTIMLTAINTLMDLNKKYTEDKIAKLEKEKKANEAKLKADYEKGIITKEELDEGLLGLQGKFDADSMALKKKEFDRNKRMQIAMSAIQGSMAVLNALATPPWPVGLVMALAAGVKTAIDIKKIKSQQFEGASGGTYFKNAGIARGGRHGSKYGEGGIAMYDRATGAEVGEIEGDEPVMVLSRNTYKNNGPLIERLLHSSLHKNGAPVTLANGGIVPVSDFKYGEMHLFGSKKKKAAARAEMEAAQAEYAAMEAEYDAGASVGIDGETQAMLEQNTKIIEDQLKALEAIEKTAGIMVNELKGHSGILQKIADKDNGAASLMHAIQQVQNNISKATLKG